MVQDKSHNFPDNLRNMDRISGSIFRDHGFFKVGMFDIQEFKDRTSLTWILDKEIRLFVLGMIRF